MNNSTNINAIVLPLSALGSYTQRPTPIASEGGPERMNPGTGRIPPAHLPGFLIQEAPRRCK